jgi:hypothetical protein
MTEVVLDGFSDRDQILNALIESKNSHSIIGITCNEIGSGTFRASVKEIDLLDDGDALIVLSSYDTTGYFLEKNRIRLSQISRVIPFVSFFDNPFLRKIERMKPTQNNANPNSQNSDSYSNSQLSS